MTWILLALIAPFFWALSNLFDKYAIEKLSKNVSDFIFFGTIGSVVVVISLLAVRGGVEIISPSLTLIAILGGFLLNYSYIFYAKALEKTDATRIVPLFQTIPIFVLVLGYLFFDELISTPQFVGFLVVFLGGIILTTQKSALKDFKINTGFWLMLTASIIISISMLFSDHVLESVSFITLFTYDLIGFSLAGISLLLYSPWRQAILLGLKEATLRKYFVFFVNDGFDLTGHIFISLRLFLRQARHLFQLCSAYSLFTSLFSLPYSLFFYQRLLKKTYQGK